MNEKKPRRLLKRARVNLIQIISFCLIAAFLTVSAFALPFRPTYSESEKRELTKFPAFSFTALFDGSYFRGIDTWFSDTFPMREMWISGNAQLRQLCGFSGKEIHGEVEDSDEIPDVEERPSFTEAESTTAVQSTTTAVTTSTATTQKQTAATQKATQKQEPATQTLGAVLVANNKGYEYYNFVRDTADRYSAALNKLTPQLPKGTKLYDMIVPTSIGITLDDNTKKSINSSDQQKAIKYMYSRLNTNINAINVYDTLIEHRNDYIYFNTDHHWTALGAYYAYEKYAQAAGKTPVPLGNYKTREFGGFLGSFYTDTGKNAALAKHPDTVVTYLPTESAKMTITNKSGQKYDWKIISDVTKSSASYKYLTFIGGDNPYSVITNREITDGSSCVVVKESFGNAFVPFLVAHYQTIHVIDYRYYNVKLADFVKNNKVQDVLFINNISATRNKNLVADIEKIIVK